MWTSICLRLHLPATRLSSVSASCTITTITGLPPKTEFSAVNDTMGRARETYCTGKTKLLKERVERPVIS